jgi:Lon protease-like protein
MQSFEQLPQALPIFPLPNVVVLPRGHLPLNIFEPRYLNMVHDALAGDRLIGMIQPTSDDSPSSLSNTGCAGRIVRYEETHDGRLEIVLTGLCRFNVASELATTRGYRLIQPNWNRYAGDFAAPVEPDPQAILLFKGVLRQYFQQTNIDVEDDVLEKLHIEDLLSSLLSFLPIEPEDRQILLEADDLAARIKSFTAILQSPKDSQLQH